MNMGNLRAILHQGVDAYFQSLLEQPQPEEDFQLLADLDGPLPRQQAVRWFGVAIEAVVENYSEYIDYNSTTTQSDRGEMLYTLLHFLRLRASYDRVAWNLKPVVLAHQVLVRCGRQEAAEIWRTAVAGRTADVADEHLKRLGRLSRNYGMRLPSIAQRLRERFVRPLAIDQLRSLVRPAIEELGSGREPVSFLRLREGIAPLAEELSGAGFELPEWLQALQQEVEQVQSRSGEDEESLDPLLRIPQVRLSLQEAQRQVKGMITSAVSSEDGEATSK